MVRRTDVDIDGVLVRSGVPTGPGVRGQEQQYSKCDLLHGVPRFCLLK
jgi:hypothetical protein